MTDDRIPFALATASISGSPSFPLIVLDDEAAISVSAIAPLAARLGHGLSAAASLHDLLEDWDRNAAALTALLTALDDADLGKYTRSSVTALEFFELQAPFAAPRQVFLLGEQITMQPATSIAGPRAKVPMPSGAQTLHAGLALGIAIGAPTYRATQAEAASSIAGATVATRYATADGETWAPGFLPIGPYLVPTPFLEPKLTGRISFNGETGQDGQFDRSAMIAAVQQVSARCQLFPGDLIICPMGDISDKPLGDGDIIETAIAGLGQQTTNIMVESKYADPGR